MYLRIALGFLAGFAVAVGLIEEIGRPWAIVLLVCGAIYKTLVAISVKWIWGADLPTLWKRHRPKQYQFWRHALAYVKGDHDTHDPLICNHCNG